MLEHVYVELMGFTLTDPLTFISDIMMAAVCFYCGHRLFYDFKESKYGKFTGLFFFFLGLSAGMGGTFHLLHFYYGRAPHLAAWLVQGVSILFIEYACIQLLESRQLRKALTVFIAGIFVFYLAQLFVNKNFTVVKYNSAMGLIGFALLIHAFRYQQTKEKRYGQVVVAILLYVIPAISHALDIHINDWVNRNVVSHIMLLPCYYYLYLSFRKVAEQQTLQPLSS